MHTLPSASTSFASLASRLASYAGGDASSLGTSALIASNDISLVIDSGASAHMTGTPSILTSYHSDSSIPNVYIANGRPCPVRGSGTSRATATLPLHNVLCVPRFPTNLSSISVITKPLIAEYSSIHIIASSRISIRNRGLDWAMRMGAVSTSWW